MLSCLVTADLNMLREVETTILFLKWLRPRQDVLAQLSAHDLRHRHLSSRYRLQHLNRWQLEGDAFFAASRAMCWSSHCACFNGHHYIAANISLKELVDATTPVLLATDVDDRFLEAVGKTFDDMAGMGFHRDPRTTWMDLQCYSCLT